MVQTYVESEKSSRRCVQVLEGDAKTLFSSMNIGKKRVGKRNENYGKQKKLEWKQLIVTVMMIQIQTLLIQNPRRFCPKKCFASTLIFPPKSRTKPSKLLKLKSRAMTYRLRWIYTQYLELL